MNSYDLRAPVPSGRSIRSDPTAIRVEGQNVTTVNDGRNGIHIGEGHMSS